MRKYLIIIFILALMGAVYIYRGSSYHTIQVELPPAQDYQDFINNGTSELAQNAVDNSSETEPAPVIDDPVVITEPEEAATETEASYLADSINLAVPFSSQSPNANWDEPFLRACEETSLLMVDYYYQNKTLPGPTEIERILIEMINWEEDNWGGHFNLPIAELAELAEATFNYRTEIINDLTSDKIKAELNAGRPVIIPADGHKLANPFFSGDGPAYHMLVIKGYVDDKFITNDPGTKRGADFIYTEENLMDSLADWDTKKVQASGPKIGLVLYKD